MVEGSLWLCGTAEIGLCECPLKFDSDVSCLWAGGAPEFRYTAVLKGSTASPKQVARVAVRSA